ncbi:hypothetical protein LCGC14_2250450 [marine sediment metagenome]|uniref:Uncharacterized protein n=1 Tax=marine sediment metagenome TaxID=412755 RepID=A0A0F9FF90_9ZZZZ
MYWTVLLVIIGMLASAFLTFYFMKQSYEKMIKHTRDVVDRIMSASDCGDVELDFGDDDDDDEDEEDGDDDGGRFCPRNRVSEYFN